MFIHFFCLCPLSLTVKLNFNISKVVYWESLCDIRPDCHHHFDASGTSNAMFDELAERSLMSPLAGTKHTYVRLAIIIYCQNLGIQGEN